MDYLKLNGQVVNLLTREKMALEQKTKKLPMALQKAILKKQKQTKNQKGENNMPYHTGKGSHGGMKKKKKKKLRNQKMNRRKR